MECSKVKIGLLVKIFQLSDELSVKYQDHQQHINLHRRLNLTQSLNTDLPPKNFQQIMMDIISGWITNTNLICNSSCSRVFCRHNNHFCCVRILTWIRTKTWFRAQTWMLAILFCSSKHQTEPAPKSQQGSEGQAASCQQIIIISLNYIAFIGNNIYYTSAEGNSIPKSHSITSFFQKQQLGILRIGFQGTVAPATWPEERNFPLLPSYLLQQFVQAFTEDYSIPIICIRKIVSISINYSSKRIHHHISLFLPLPLYQTVFRTLRTCLPFRRYLFVEPL